MLVHRLLPCICLAALAACSPVIPGIEEGEHYTEGFAQLSYTRLRKVDILLVLDNSSSMAEEQALLVDNLAPLIEVLEYPDVEADYRIAITTTDAGHPACTSGTPERGAFVLTPCTTRLDEFVADGEGGSNDLRALACTDICELDAAELERLPTTTDEDPNPAPRPWLESSNGRTNLPAGVAMAEALRCFAPQGIAGCDFEMPLEAMYQALRRAKDANDPAYGFLRKDAALLVVIVTDEDDCSPAPGADDIFSSDGDKLFWPNPNATAPSSAVCWNAGVTCVGDPSNYDSCESTNKDRMGNVAVADHDAVLQPLTRYIEQFDEIMLDKRAIDPTQRPLIGILAGVGPHGRPKLADVGLTDPEFQQTFGIGPGCQTPGQDFDHPIRATPPIRLLAAQAALVGGEGLSICEADWTPVIEILGLAGWWPHSNPLHPACFPHCALDTDFSTSALEPDCIVQEELPDGSHHHIRECARDDTGYLVDPETHDYRMPADDVHVCHTLLWDSGGSTSDINDDLSQECADDGHNLEFKIARRLGHPAAAGTRVTATCSLAPYPSLHCPGLD